MQMLLVLVVAVGTGFLVRFYDYSPAYTVIVPGGGAVNLAHTAVWQVLKQIL